MSYTATVLKVMIASPSDVSSERVIIREVIHEWNAVNSENRGVVLMPIGWETHASPEFKRPQEAINKQVLEGADLLVATFWTRVGSSTGKAISGTIEEIEHHLKAGKPAMLYFSAAPVSPQNLDPKQTKALNKFRKECEKRSLFESYESTDQFRDKFNRQLSQAIQRDFASLFNKAPVIIGNSVSGLSDDAKSLLISATLDESGTISRYRTADGLHIETNGSDYVDGDNPREEARWEAAIEELIAGKYVNPVGTRGETIRVTKSGYDIVGSF